VALARPIRRSQSVSQPQDDLGIGVQLQPAQLDLRPEELIAILNYPLKVVLVSVGDFGHLHFDFMLRSPKDCPMTLAARVAPPFRSSRAGDADLHRADPEGYRRMIDAAPDR
jgi:hypothetical protein